MKQVLIQGGTARIEDVPAPTVCPGCVLVRVHHSLISTGTELSQVAGGGMLSLAWEKAKDPAMRDKLKRKLAAVGPKSTLDLVRTKLSAPTPPGYSSAGVVVAVGEGVTGFQTGDRVACAGAGYASHAEYNCVPHQLVTPIPEGVDFDTAAFVALGAIALQGVRRAEPTLGETVVVLGLGLVGQLAVQLLAANGCAVIACDPWIERQELASRLGAVAVCAPEGLEAAIADWTAGYGADAALVCAAARDSRVTRQAVDCCRPKGRVVVVGAVGLHLEREPLYEKEIDFRLSCSYGPGRYAVGYEEQGLDYPIGEVRWTEGRNMAAFLRLLAAGKVDVQPLISEVCPIDDAPRAYETLKAGDAGRIAVLLEYGAAESTAMPQRTLVLRSGAPSPDTVRIGVIGAGGIAQGYHMPHLAAMEIAVLAGVADTDSVKAKTMGDRFGAHCCTTDYRELLDNDGIDAVIIATRHHLHTEMTLAALAAGKHVYVEKPLALTVADCEAICDAVETSGCLLTVGFNRRCSVYTQQLKSCLDELQSPKQIVYRCNAGPIEPDHWAVDPVQGGGRILGEAVHFFDCCSYLLGGDPVSQCAEHLGAASGSSAMEDNLSAVLRYPDGSLATVIYCSTGSASIPKERIEVFANDGAAVIDNFEAIQFAGLPGTSTKRRHGDKGAAALLANFVQAIRGEEELVCTAQDGLSATRIAAACLDMGTSP